MFAREPHFIVKFLKRLLIWLLVTILIAVGTLYGVMYILVKGPSPTARNLFVRSVRETSAMYWLADLFLTEEEITEIENAGEDVPLEETDTSLVTIVATEPVSEDGPVVDDWGLCDEDGDGIVLEQVNGFGYMGYMLVVYDPSRIMLGTPEKFGGAGLTVQDMCLKYDCVAGINGGGFEDSNGTGSGGIPLGMTVVNGEVAYGAEGGTYNFVGFDDNYILHTGKMKPAEARERNIQFGCSFGPVLVLNGEKTEDTVLSSGVNPRTAIGQRSDGAVLLLVVDGRQAHSLGATYSDMADVMLSYGAVNACNLDGGSSTVLWFDGEYINHCASVIGFRPLPTAFLVKKEGA